MSASTDEGCTLVAIIRGELYSILKSAFPKYSLTTFLDYGIDIRENIDGFQPSLVTLDISMQRQCVSLMDQVYNRQVPLDDPDCFHKVVTICRERLTKYYD